MAGPKETTAVKTKSKSRKRYFLCCFGISKKSSNPKQFQDEVKSSAIPKKKNRFFFWRRFRVTKTAIQTVPVETISPNNLNRVSEIEEIPSSPDQTINPTPQIKETKSSISETRKSSESNACQDIKRICISEQTSPREKFSILTKALSHSVSFPAIQTTTMARKGLGIRKRGEGSKKMDTMIGMSIIMVTLVIMVIWGKFCAILCTSAWLYFVPRIRQPTKLHNVRVKNGEMMKPVETPMSPEQYKKKVVLEGLLRRSRRKNRGI